MAMLRLVFVAAATLCLSLASADDICLEPKVVGHCRALIPSFWYNAQTNTCEPFNYGGCGGNNNRFSSKGDCERRCKKEPEISACGMGEPELMICPPMEPLPDFKLDVPVCFQPKVVGPCRAAFPSYWFNYKTNKCEKFTYGGCGGNDNRFISLSSCQQKCKQPEPEIAVCPFPEVQKPEPVAVDPRAVCMEPKKVGPGRARMTRYYYNQKRNKCYRFYFGGMGANGNNFKSRSECNKKCRVNKSKRS